MKPPWSVMCCVRMFSETTIERGGSVHQFITRISVNIRLLRNDLTEKKARLGLIREYINSTFFETHVIFCKTPDSRVVRELSVSKGLVMKVRRLRRIGVRGSSQKHTISAERKNFSRFCYHKTSRGVSKPLP